MGTADSSSSDAPRRRWSRKSPKLKSTRFSEPSSSTAASDIHPPSHNQRPAPSSTNNPMSAVRRLLTGQDSSAKMRVSRNVKQPVKQPPQPCAVCVENESRQLSPDQQLLQLRQLSQRSEPDTSDRLESVIKGDYHRLLRLFQVACDVQLIVGTPANNESPMAHLHAERLNLMGITLYGQQVTITLVSNGAGVLFICHIGTIISLLWEGIQFDVTESDDTPIDLILKAVIESSLDADLDDLQAILSSVRFATPADEPDAIDDLNAGGLDIPGLNLLRAEFYTTRVLCMMLKTDIYEQGFYRKYVHVDRLGTTFTSVREGESSVLTNINVLPDAISRPVKNGSDIIGEDLFMIRRKGRKDKFRLSCSVSVNVWEEYETPEWFGYIHPPPNADAMRPANLEELRDRLEAYGVPDGMEVCRIVYHCLGHKSKNANVKVDTLAAARGYFMYMKNFLKHGTTGSSTNHIIEGDELAVVYDGIAFRVSAPQTEIRHKSLFMSLLISDERERNGKNIPKRSIIRRMCSTSEVVLSLCRDITYLNAEYDENGGTLYSASAEEENLSEAWTTCVALYVCDGYGCLEGCFNCAIESRRGAIVDESAVFMNDVQVPVVFDKLYRKSTLAEELSAMSDARGATYPGAFISGRDQCNERTYLAGRRHRMSGESLMAQLQREAWLGGRFVAAGLLGNKVAVGIERKDGSRVVYQVGGAMLVEG